MAIKLADLISGKRSLNPVGRPRKKSAMQRREDAEDEYYWKLGNLVEKHPIGGKRAMNRLAELQQLRKDGKI